MEYSTQGDNVTQSKTNGANAVNAAWQSQPIANVGFDFTVSGNSLTVNSKTRFFTDTTGEYYVAAYISLDNLYAEQNLQGQGYIDRWQNKVIQFAMTTGSNFGMQAFNGSITSDTEADETFTYNLDASWVRSDVWAVCMIWKKVGTKYVYVNCTQKRVAEPTGILQAAEILHVKVYPTVSAGSIRVEADVQQAGGMLTVTV